MQVIALSATIKNADDVAEWLEAQCITTEWRPTKLYEGVAHGNTIIFRDGTIKKLRPINAQDALNIAMNSVLDGGQALISLSLADEPKSAVRDWIEQLVEQECIERAASMPC
jgi:helicase